MVGHSRLRFNLPERETKLTGEAAAPSAGTLAPKSPAARDEQQSSPIANRSVALNVIAVLLVFFALYFAASVLVPIASAVLLSMLLAPPVQLLEKLYLPRPLASAIVVLTMIALLASGLLALAGPAKSWIEQTPQSLHRIQDKLHAFAKPFEDIKKATDQLQEQNRSGAGSGPQEVRVVRPALADIVLIGTPQAVGAVLSVTVLLYFLLASGDVFLRKLVIVIPTFHDKKRAVEITRQIETDISFYLLNFTMVNVGLGLAMALVTAALGIPNPLLWGVVVAVLNFVPYVGAVTSMAILAMVGTLSTPE